MKSKWIGPGWILLLFFLLVFGCYSKKNQTQERAKERINQFVFLMANDQVEAAEKLLSTEMIESGNKELFLSNFDDWQLKDSADVKVEIQEIFVPPKNAKNRALVSMTIRSVKNDFTKVVSLPIRYERGDWYIGS
ncbi:MAG: hypothetical protein WCE90_06680 [Candidatus Zixiibacteriota bacterium]|jgi:hypothetical protein